jgi:hypothetical protein
LDEWVWLVGRLVVQVDGVGLFWEVQTARLDKGIRKPVTFGAFFFFLSFSFCKRYHNYFSGVGGSDGKRGILQLLLIRNRINTNLGMSWLDFTFIEYLLGISDDNSLSSWEQWSSTANLSTDLRSYTNGSKEQREKDSPAPDSPREAHNTREAVRTRTVRFAVV